MIKTLLSVNLLFALLFFDAKAANINMPATDAMQTAKEIPEILHLKAGTDSFAYFENESNTDVFHKGNTILSNTKKHIKEVKLWKSAKIRQAGEIPTHFQERPAMCRVYPNPATEQVNVSLITQQGGEMRIEVYDIIGTLAKTQVYSLVNGENNFILAVKDLIKGVYILNIITQQKKQVVKLIISK